MGIPLRGVSPKTVSEVAAGLGVGTLATKVVEERTSLRTGDTLNTGVTLRIPLGSSMSDFERAIFKDLKGLPLVNFILQINSINPIEIAASIAAQIGSFADLINDINGTDSADSYFSEAGEFLSRIVKGVVSGDKILDGAQYGITVIYDPMDAILPDVAEYGYSMSLKNQLTYSLSRSRIEKYAKSYRFDKRANEIVVEI